MYKNDAHGRVHYDGQWAANQKHGRGRLEFLRGAFYDGAFEHDVFCGRGLWRVADGTEFEGRFVQNFLVDGTVRYTDGSVYVGELSKHRPHGHGRLRRPDRAEYDGAWADGVQSGAGVCTYANGVVFIGMFAKNARCDGECELRYPDGTRFRGMCHGAKRAGVGELVYANGDVYRGEFSDDQPHGSGEIVYAASIGGGDSAHRDRYCGRFERGRPVVSENLRLAALRLAVQSVHDVRAQAATEVRTLLNISEICHARSHIVRILPRLYSSRFAQHT